MTIEDYNWNAIKKAIEILMDNEHVNKLDGLNWTVYKVGTIIRLDLKEKK